MRDNFAAVSSVLAGMSDSAVAKALHDAPVLGRGIGGSRAVLHLEHGPIFVKRVPLTDRELEPANHRSTANLFDLPAYCQYGVGSPGFTAWRELAANERLTALALDPNSMFDAVPMLYHWRVLEGSAFDGEMPEELADPAWLAERWHGSAEVATRVAAIEASSTTLALFLEYVPHRLDEWLTQQLHAAEQDAAHAVEWIEDQLRSQVTAMNRHGIFHFDAHFANILTDGTRLHLADLGLATSPSFDLSPPEQEFLARHMTYDTATVLTRLVNLIVVELCDAATTGERDALVEEIATKTSRSATTFTSAAAVIDRYAPVARVINRFNRDLHGADRRTPFPGAEATEALEKAGVTVIA